MALSEHLRAKDWTFAGTSRVAQRRNEIALYVLIASLAMFFIAGVIGYLLIRLRAGDELQELRLPPILWVSTALALTGSTFLWRALRSVRRERQDLFRRQVVASFIFGSAFCVTQSLGLSYVLEAHRETTKARPVVDNSKPVELPKVIVPWIGATRGLPSEVSSEVPDATVPRQLPIETRMEGLLFVLILLHGLHFIAGLVGLTIVTARALAGRYDHEYHGGVKLCAVYWRFMDVVWIVLFGAFLLTT